MSDAIEDLVKTNNKSMEPGAAVATELLSNTVRIDNTEILFKFPSVGDIVISTPRKKVTIIDPYLKFPGFGRLIEVNPLDLLVVVRLLTKRSYQYLGN